MFRLKIRTMNAMSKAKTSQIDMTNGSPYRLILRFALPLFVGNLLQQLYNMVDSFVVGQYVGQDALAGVGASFPVMFLFVALFAGVAVGSSIIISQYFGARDQASMQRAVDTIYKAFIVSATVLTFVGFFLSEPLLRLISLPEEAIAHALPYLQIIFLGTIFSFGYNVNAGILQGIGDTKSLLYYLTVSVVANIGLDLWFVAGLGWGTAGAAWATIIAQALSFGIGVWHINKRAISIRIRVKGTTFDWNILKDSIRLGIPAGIGNMSYSLGALLLQNLVNQYGNAFIAGFTAANKIDAFAFLPIMTIGNTMTSFVGQNVGAGKIDRVIKGVKAAIVMTLVISLVISPLCLIFGPNLIALFQNDPLVIDAGMAYLTRMLPYIFLLGVMMVLLSALRGTGQAFIPFFVQALSLWVARVPLAYVFAHYFGRDNMFYSFPIGWVLGALVAVPYFLSGRWRIKIRQASGIKGGSLTVLDE